MTAPPARAATDFRSPRTSSGAAPFAPDLIAATNVARLRASQTLAYADWPISGPYDALASSADALPRPSRAAPPSPKSP